MQALQTWGLVLVGVPFLTMSCWLTRERLLALIRRTRWIMVSLLLIYAYATPGNAMWPEFAQYSPTREGMVDGLLQLSRLVLALASLAVLLHFLPQQRLISGIYTLSYPLSYLGLSRERLAVRLALTLHYAEHAMQQKTTHWHDNLAQMMTPVGATQHTVELITFPFVMRDVLLLVLGSVLLVFVFL